VVGGEDVARAPIFSVVSWSICGMALSGVLVFVTGFLGVQAAGQQLGAVLDLNNTVVAVTSPRVPFLTMFAMAALGAAVLYVLTLGARSSGRGSRLAIVVAFALATLLLVVWSFLISSSQGLGNDSSLVVSPGWKGWLEKGGVSPVVHLMIVVSVGSIWLYPGSREDGLGKDIGAVSEL
jgi:hypothetical protein